jgi:hypothetical protein
MREFKRFDRALLFQARQRTLAAGLDRLTQRGQRLAVLVESLPPADIG